MLTKKNRKHDTTEHRWWYRWYSKNMSFIRKMITRTIDKNILFSHELWYSKNQIAYIYFEDDTLNVYDLTLKYQQLYTKVEGFI